MIQDKKGLQSDIEILEQCELNEMIVPYVTESTKVNEQGERILSYGPSSYGYDLRLDNSFKVFHNRNPEVVIDPKNPIHLNLTYDDVTVTDRDYILVPPNGFILGSSVERIKMPRDFTGVVLGKSTLARSAIECLTTPLEAGWEGHVTLEFSNASHNPVKLYINEGCCQVLFFKGNECGTSYADRGGKYQNQAKGPIVSKV